MFGIYVRVLVRAQNFRVQTVEFRLLALGAGI